MNPKSSAQLPSKGQCFPEVGARLRGKLADAVKLAGEVQDVVAPVLEQIEKAQSSKENRELAWSTAKSIWDEVTRKRFPLMKKHVLSIYFCVLYVLSSHILVFSFQNLNTSRFLFPQNTYSYSYVFPFRSFNSQFTH